MYLNWRGILKRWIGPFAMLTLIGLWWDARKGAPISAVEGWVFLVCMALSILSLECGR